MIGQIIGKYRVLDRVGRGGMGTVYRATDETLQREVALKVLNAELNDPEVARRFRAEAITVARLSHPGIATIYELFQHDGQWLMVMEFVRGETLEHLVNRSGPLAPHRAGELCMQALIGLAHAHSLGVVHRDLKPANLMINETGAVKIMDFGIARVSGSEHLTNAGFMMGTPAYMAPEQVMGADVDQRADLYAMGVVFYRLTTAKLPFKGETPFAMAQSQVNDPPTPVMLARPDLPTWVETLIARALAKAPKERFQSAGEFHDAFARSLAGMPLLDARRRIRADRVDDDADANAARDAVCDAARLADDDAGAGVWARGYLSAGAFDRSAGSRSPGAGSGGPETGQVERRACGAGRRRRARIGRPARQSVAALRTGRSSRFARGTARERAAG